MRSLHANMEPPPAEGNFCYDSDYPNLTLWNGTTGTWVMSTILIVWLTAIQ